MHCAHHRPFIRREGPPPLHYAAQLRLCPVPRSSRRGLPNRGGASRGARPRRPTAMVSHWRTVSMACAASYAARSFLPRSLWASLLSSPVGLLMRSLVFSAFMSCAVCELAWLWSLPPGHCGPAATCEAWRRQTKGPRFSLALFQIQLLLRGLPSPWSAGEGGARLLLRGLNPLQHRHPRRGIPMV